MVWKLTKLHHEVLHIYVHAYSDSAYKNKNIVTIHTFIKMDLKTPWFSSFMIYLCAVLMKRWKKSWIFFCLTMLWPYNSFCFQSFQFSSIFNIFFKGHHNCCNNFLLMDILCFSLSTSIKKELKSIFEYKHLNGVTKWLSEWRT